MDHINFRVKSSAHRNKQGLPGQRFRLSREGALPAHILRLQRGLQGRPRQVPRRRGLRLHRGRRQDPQLPQVSLQSVFGEEERTPVLLILPDILTGWSLSDGF